MAEDLGFRFTWFGHSCVEIETEAGTRILFDPWLGNPRSPASADSMVYSPAMPQAAISDEAASSTR